MSDEASLPSPFDEGGREIEDQAPRRPVITLLSDFGVADHYSGVMKGVILALNPEVQIVDITHSIEPFDIHGGALTLAAAYHYFPKGTIHVAVVDPGVGGERRGIMVATENYYFVGPDNGVLTYVLEDPSYLWTRELQTVQFFLEKVSTTFHGRDVFAPVAAYLSAGEPPEDFGPIIPDPVRIERKQPRVDAQGVIAGEVIYVDRFGNLITNIDTGALWEGESRMENLDREFLAVIEVCGRLIRGMSESYQSVPAGELGAHFNSWSLLEVFVPGGSAARTLGAGKGTPVRVRFEQLG